MTTETLLAPMTSQNDLPLALFVAKEGLAESRGFKVYEGLITFSELAEHFSCEANADVLDESEKMQRDVDAPRVKGIRNYLLERPDTLLPNLTILATHLTEVKAVQVGNRQMVTAVLPGDSDRFIADGQGRTTTIKELLNEGHSRFEDRTISFKLIVTASQSIREVREQTRQIFSDLNDNTKHSNSSIGLFYDSSKPYSRLLKTLLGTNLDSIGKPLQSLIALNGKVKTGQLWSYKQLSAFVTKVFGMTEGALNKELADLDVYAEFEQVAKLIIAQSINRLPLAKLTDPEFNPAEAMFTKALFATALGWVCRSVMEDAAHNDEEINWEALTGLNDLPLLTLDDPIWLNAGVCLEDKDRKQERVVKIMKGSDRKIARVACRALRVFPCSEI